MIATWVLLSVAAGCAVLYGLIRLFDVMRDRRYRRVTEPEQVNVAELRKQFAPKDPPSNVFIVDWRERLPYDQDADES